MILLDMNLFFPFIVSFLATVLAIPLTIKLATKYGLIDDPAKRPHPAHIHKTIVPRAGGLAIYIGIVLSMVIFLTSEKHLIGIILGATVLLIIGLLDDRRNYFNPYIRLLLLFLSAAMAVAAGIGISFIANPFSGLSFLPSMLKEPFVRLDSIAIPINFFGMHFINLLADIFAFLYIVTLTQVINWSKGVDGQMPGITFVTAVTLGILSLKLYAGGDPAQLDLAKLAFILAGASLAFLIFNWHPAKILPGFSGSTILAFMLACLSILSGAKVATALLVLALPSIDFIYTILRRIFSGKSPVWGDRGHLHHRLLDLGFSPPQIALFYILVSVILGVVAIIVDSQSKFFGILMVAIVFIGFILWLNSFRDRKINN